MIRGAVLRWTARALMSIVALTLALLVADRVIGAVNGPILKPINAMGLTSGVSTAGTRLRPGFTGTYTNAEFSIHVQVNAQGLRGPDIALSKTAGTRRILALGDSFTFGQGVQYEQAWPKLVERHVGAGSEVINAGWAAGSPRGYERYLTTHGAVFDADVVLIALFVGNDIVEDLAERQGLERAIDQIEFTSRYLHNLQLRVGAGGAIRELIEAAVPNLYEIAALMLVKAQYALGSRRTHFDHIVSEPESEELAAGWADTLRTIDRIAMLSTTRGARMGLIIIPFLDQLPEGAYGSGFSQERPQRRLMEHCARQQLPCLDLLGAFRTAAAANRTPLYYVKDGHWTPRGHQVASDVIAAWLIESGLVPRP